MPLPLVPVDSRCQEDRLLTAGWQFALLPPGRASTLAELGEAASSWIEATVPGTALADLFASGQANFDRHPAIDEFDIWYRCRFGAETAEAADRRLLIFDGLATLAEVWLNGVRLLESSNMYLQHSVEVTSYLRNQNELLIRFSSLTSALKTRRPRPRWRTRLVEQQQLRWCRTTLLGRIPGWTPPVPAVGPWKAVRLVHQHAVRIENLDVRSSLDGTTGLVVLRCIGRTVPDRRLISACLIVGELEVPLSVSTREPDGWQITGEAQLPDVRLWWPHTHGDPTLYPVSLLVTSDAGTHRFDLGKTGFRRVLLQCQGADFALRVNGVPVFCRGACWTTTDMLRLVGTEAATREALQLARDAGMNMLRVGGTMFYEADHFYALCDEFGILLWHDWMFANMDYPADDEAFVASVTAEARQFLQRNQLSPSLALLCGNSEIEQQAAMLGLEKPLWRNRLFAEELPAIGADLRPDIPFWPSSPAGGVLPFQVDSGAAHYFGVGAYLQPLTDARRCGVRFTSECLAFANVPENDTVEELLAEGQSPVHHPRWKARVPRDSGPGWDFDDVRDHYLAELYRVDPMRLRYADVDRYLYLSRVVTGEVMAATFAEWRRKDSACSGGLVWFLRDLWPGAGWGVMDARGRPKAAWYYLRRAFAPVGLFMTNEGVNGIALHAINDLARDLKAQLTLSLYKHGEHRVAEASQSVSVSAHGALEVRGDALFGHFLDTTYSYRFGPPGHDLVHAVLRDENTGQIVGEDFLFPLGHAFPVRGTLDVEARMTSLSDGRYAVRLHAERFAQSLSIEARGFHVSDNYFHLAPGASRDVTLTPLAGGARVQVSVGALNAAQRVRLAVPAGG